LQKNISTFRQALTRGFVIASVTALFGLAAVCGSVTAFAQNITVASPVNGSNVPSPTWVRAHNVGCNSLAPVAFGYSVDNGANVMWGVTPYDVDVVTSGIGSGSHTVYFKSWTVAGLCPVASTSFSIGGGSPGSSPAPSASNASSNVPSNASATSDLDIAGNWAWEHDNGTPGWAKGSTVFPATTPLYDDAREFYMEYSGHGGERWHISMGNNAGGHNFALDTYVYFTDPSQVGNLELDFNQVMPNGQTVIYGTQCSSYSNTWEITYTDGSSHWRPSNVPCNPKSWAPNTWHHIQIGFHRDDSGYVVHDWVNLDGTHSTFNNAGGPGALWLGWPTGLLLVNYQVDGALGNGSVTSFVHKMTIYSW
jgi:hypothetical protein